MVLKIKDKSFELERFNLNVSENNNPFKQRLECILMNYNSDFNNLSSDITENFDGSLTIVTSFKTYNFEGFVLSNIDMSVNNKTETINIYFNK